MQQLQNDCLDKPSRQNANNDPSRKTKIRNKKEHMADKQAGFRKDRSTVQQILILRLLTEK